MIKKHYRLNGLVQIRVSTHNLESYRNSLLNVYRYEEELEKYLKTSLTRVALEHAAPSLYSQVQHNDKFINVDKQLEGVFKYFNRHANRTVPFGLFVAHRAYKLRNKHEVTSVLDFPRLAYKSVMIRMPSCYIEHYNRRISFDPRELVGLNPTIVEFDDVYSWVSLDNRIDGNTKNMRLKRTELLTILANVLKNKDELLISQLVEIIRSRFHDLDLNQIKNYLVQLADIGFIQPISTPDNQVDQNMSYFTFGENNSKIFGLVNESIHEMRSIYESSISSEDKTSKIGAEFIDYSLAENSEIHLNNDEIQLLEEASNIIILTSAQKPEYGQFVQRWSEKFVEKFGIMHPVKLVDALNSYIGIGPLYGYTNPAPVYTDLLNRSSEWSEDDLSLRVDMLLKAKERGELRSVDLKDTYFANRLWKLEHNYELKSIYPDFDFSIQVGHKNGRRTFLYRSDSVALGGHTFTRSRRTMNTETMQLWLDILNHLAEDQGVNKGLILISKPISAKVDYLVPDYIESVKTLSTESGPGDLLIDDIYVMVDTEGLMIGTIDCDDRFTKQIANHPTLVIPLAFRNEARAVVDISRGNYKIPAGFSWAQLEDSEFLPEVRYGDIVLRPAEWKISKELVEASKNSIRSKDVSILRHELQTMGIVGEFFFASGDNRLHFDSLSDVSISALAKILRHASRGDRIEKSSLDSDRGTVFKTVNGENTYSTEMIYSVSRRTSSAQTIKNTYSVSVMKIPKPEKDWITIIMYTTPDTINSLVSMATKFTNRLLMDKEISSWFFVRYNDSGCSLRLRWKITDQDNRFRIRINELVKLAHDSALIRGWELRDYIPETSRYGTGELLKIVHKAFELSAIEAMVGIMDLSDASLSMSYGDALHNIIEYMSALGVSLKYIYNVLPDDSSPTDEARAYWRTINRGTADELKVLFEIGTHIESRIFEQFKSKIDSEGQLSELIRDLLHMHVNRMHSSGDEFESSLYWLLRRAINKKEIIDAKHSN